ncbi:ABC transporter permease [Clostridium kluyveri]|uniref:ABC transporter permease n=1 Tax=Clostridium kluyveri TaxID=1534 RepID=UPI0022481729|nr:FtsX-like permease family protein [Clostridium kluyveri]UZQ51420.1 FtsX-like permease family protein [Clostridium kluyveri]
MKFKDILKVALNGLGSRKGRTFLTSLAVAIGTMLIVTLVSIGTSGENLILKEVDVSQLKQIQVMNFKYYDMYETDSGDIDMNDMFKKIGGDTVEKFKDIKNVENVQAFVNTSAGSIKIENKEDNQGTKIIALYNNDNYFTDEKIASVRDKNKDSSLKPIIAGRNLVKSDKEALLVSKKYLDSMGIKNYNEVLGKDALITQSRTNNSNITLQPFQIKAKIVGIIGDKFHEDEKIISSLDIASEISSYTSLQKDYIENLGYDSVIVYTKDSKNVSDITNSIKKMGYLYVSYQDMIEKIQNSFKVIKVILALLGLIVLFVASVGIVNTMTMVIYERTRFIGIMKALGANRNNIHNIFITQSGVIGFIGGIMGIVFSSINLGIIQFALNMYMKSRDITQSVNLNMPLWLPLATLAFSIAISIISGIYPSRKASKMNPVDALNS